MALLILAGLQMIPADVYEAAKVDGASAWQRFRLITLPLVKPALMVARPVPHPGRAAHVRPADILTGGGARRHATTTLSILVVNQIRQGFNARVGAVDDHVPPHLPASPSCSSGSSAPTSCDARREGRGDEMTTATAPATDCRPRATTAERRRPRAPRDRRAHRTAPTSASSC